MRRVPVLVSLVAVMLLGMLALHAQPVAVAQEATPAAGVMEPEGVTFEPIAIASGLTLPSPADMIAIRFNIEPGAGFPLEASDPTAGMLIVESGARGPLPVAAASIPLLPPRKRPAPLRQRTSRSPVARRSPWAPATPPTSRAMSAGRSETMERSRPWRSASSWDRPRP